MNPKKDVERNKKYEYRPHTADTYFVAYGKDIEELFKNSALALINLITDTAKVRPRKEVEIEVEGKDDIELLFGFLNEFIYLLDAEYFLLHDVKELKIEKDKLKATVVGDEINESYKLFGSIKAVTFNNLRIEKKNGVYEAHVVVDQ